MTNVKLLLPGSAFRSSPGKTAHQLFTASLASEQCSKNQFVPYTSSAAKREAGIYRGKKWTQEMPVRYGISCIIKQGTVVSKHYLLIS